jgi:hypothetical protein
MLSYRSSLRLTLRQTAAAYGYALSISTTSALLTSVHGSPGTGDLFLFVVGGLSAFALLDAVLETIGHGDQLRPDQAFPFAGALNIVAIGGALGASVGVAHAIGSDLAWLLAPLAATAVYMTLVAAQVAAVGALRG